jgi:hypothetical protein
LRLTPRSAAVAAIVAINILAIATVALLPGALAGSAGGSGTAADGSRLVAGALAQDTWLTATPSPTASPSPTATPSSAATPTPSPTPRPTPRPTRKPTPKPKPKPLPDTVAGARQYVRNAIGLTQYNCVDYIWTRESKWNPRAGKPAGAYGIPQAFPGSKMSKFGSNWLTSPITQVKWGIWYVNSRYGSACDAYAFWKANGWY